MSEHRFEREYREPTRRYVERRRRSWGAILIVAAFVAFAAWVFWRLVRP